SPSAIGSRHLGRRAVYQIQASKCVGWGNFLAATRNQNLSGAHDPAWQEFTKQVETGMDHQKPPGQGFSTIEARQVRRRSDGRGICREFFSRDRRIPAWTMDRGNSKDGSNSSDSGAPLRIWVADPWRRS